MSYYLEKCIILKDYNNKKFNFSPHSRFLHYLQLMVAKLGASASLAPSVEAVTLFF